MHDFVLELFNQGFLISLLGLFELYSIEHTFMTRDLNEAATYEVSKAFRKVSKF